VPDIDIIDETIAAFDAEFEETRERLVAFLIEGGASDASRSDRL